MVPRKRALSLPCHSISSLCFLFIFMTIMTTHTFCGDPISCHSDAWIDLPSLLIHVLAWCCCWLGFCGDCYVQITVPWGRYQEGVENPRMGEKWEKEAFPHFIPMKTSVKLHWNGYYGPFCWCWCCASSGGNCCFCWFGRVTFAHFAFHFLGWRFFTRFG